MVQVADLVCVLCGETHTIGAVLVVYRHRQLPPVCDRGDSVDCKVTSR